MTDRTMKVLVIGDTVGEPGRRACRELIPRLKKREQIDFVIVNGENLAGGSGITEATGQEIFEAGTDVITSGDHYFDKKEAFNYLMREPRILRPLNYPSSAPGHGSVIVETPKGKVGVMNLLGRVFMQPHVECPFTRAREEVDKIRKETPIIIIDFHAEATSEKIALGWYLDGQVSAIFGTHTHIQTADERVLPRGTGYITEVGMTGPYHSVLGRDIEAVLNRFLTQVPTRFPVAEGDARLSGAMLQIDTVTGKALSVSRIHERLEA